jgi:hypothetical protein
MSIISDEYAVYLPAVNSQYAETIVRPIPANRPFPNTFSLEDLMFWKDNNKLWHHPHFLHSVGSYKTGTLPDNAVTRRGMTDGILFGDSGGYQIGCGTLKGLDTLTAEMDANAACAAWREAYDVRTWILSWLETHTNYAMTIDMPLWAKYEPKSPFHLCSEDQLIQLTVENLQFIDSHRQDRTKWLNVIQGSDITAIKKWWDAVKWFKGSGYALSSSAGKMSGLGTVIEPLLLMRDENAFEQGRDWIHMLGVSTAPWAVMFSALQKALQATANKDLRISYDSSSPFQDAGMREEMAIVPSFGTDKKDWVIKKVRFKHSRAHVGSNEALPVSSPIADQLTLGHLNVRDEYGIYTARQVDALSLVLAINHNVWAYLETFKQANTLVFATNRNQVPNVYKEIVDLIEYVFTAENWADVLHRERKLFGEFKG